VPDIPNLWLAQYLISQKGHENIEVRGLGGFTHIRCPLASRNACPCGRYACHVNSLVIAIDGACQGNGTDEAVASACGAYFGPLDDFHEINHSQVRRNWAWHVRNKPGYAHTNQRAELHAAIGALFAAKQFAAEGGQWPCKPGGCPQPRPCPVNHVIIKSDSAYLVNSMKGSLLKWQSNGWRTA
jgi:ribonuclease HI